MAHYLLQDYVRMVQLYYGNNRNPQAAADLFANNNPNGRHPDRNVVVAAVRRFEESGNVVPQRTGGHAGLAPEFQEEVLERVENDPRTSTRAVGRAMGISHKTVHKVLRQNELHPYHFTKVQRLELGDFARRQNFCAMLLQKFMIDDLFIPSILWTDECTFTRDGIFNAHNYHYYAVDNPHLTWDSNSQHRFKLNVWAGLIDDHLVGPVFLPEILNGDRYLEFLMHTLPDFLEGIYEDHPMWYMHDGCPAHKAVAVRNYLTDTFGPDMWIGNNAPHWHWPPRSPDLTPCDYFLWGTIKDKVYFNPIENLDQLRTNVLTAFNEIRVDHNMIRRATAAAPERARRCYEAFGGQFQHLP